MHFEDIKNGKKPREILAKKKTPMILLNGKMSKDKKTNSLLLRKKVDDEKFNMKIKKQPEIEN